MSWLNKFRVKKSQPEQPVLYDYSYSYGQRLSLLTTEEYKNFMLLREGFTKKECAKRLNMKRSEARDCVKSIYWKLHIRSLAELIVKYREDVVN